MKRLTAGRIAAYLGVGVGLAVSIWANVAHARTQPDGWQPTPEMPTWEPDGGALFLAAFWPTALFIALEVLSRTAWAGRIWPWVARGGVAVVASVAAVVSYLHLHGLLTHYGENPVSALIGPLAIDGLMAVCAAALLTTGHEPVQGVVEPVHDAPPEPAEQPTDPIQQPPVTRPSEPIHHANPQVTASERPKAPVSQAAVDKVMAAVRSGQPMGKAQIVKATGLSPSTATRAVSHLVEVGRLTAIGEPHRPDYVLAQNGAVTRS